MKFIGDELEEIKGITSIYDKYHPLISKKVKESSTFTKLVSLAKDFMSRNESKLLTNIVGRQVLFNQNEENQVYDAFNLDKKDIRESIINSEYFKKFGKELTLTDQLCLAIPLLLASLEYKRIGKQEESNLCYLLMFYKPYASRISYHFKFGVNEDQMLYTLENSLSGKFDIIQYGTVNNVIQKKASESYKNYIVPIKDDAKLSDRDIHIIYNSGVATRINAFLGAIAGKYKENAGKSASYDQSAQGVLDKDNDSMEYEDADIQSDVAIKTNIIQKVVLRLNKDPLDNGLIKIAAKLGFESPSMQYWHVLSSAIEEITDKMEKELPDFYAALIGSFLFHISPSGRKYTMEDFKTPIFINVGIDILAGKKSHLEDKNMLTARRILNKMAELSDYYMQSGESYHRKFKKALAAYFVLLVKNTK